MNLGFKRLVFQGVPWESNKFFFFSRTGSGGPRGTVSSLTLEKQKIQHKSMFFFSSLSLSLDLRWFQEILPFKYLCWFCYRTELPRDLLFVNDVEQALPKRPAAGAVWKQLKGLRFGQGSLNGTHFGGIRQYKSMVNLSDLPYNNALFGLVM